MTAYRQYLTNAEGEPMGYEFIYPDDAPDYDDWEGGMDQNDPADDPNHSHYTDMDFDTDALNITGNVNKECSFCGEPVYGPWDESYYEGPEDASLDGWLPLTTGPDVDFTLRENRGFGYC